MKRSKTLFYIGLLIAWMVLLTALRFRLQNKLFGHDQEEYHKGTDIGQKNVLQVAFLPVTCHLTCPVTDYASKTTTTGTRFDALRFAEFPPIVEALKTRQLQAGFLTVPLAMKMREQGAPIRICCLGHRDGSQLVIRKENPATDMHGMIGKTIAIPSPFSNENFFLTKMIRDQGLRPDQFNLVVIPPPDMVAALSSKAIDGFIVAEPFCSKSELVGIGRVLYYAKQIWPNYISCCLVVHEDLIRERKQVVADLVRGIVESGEWAETNRRDAAKLASAYFRQDEKLLDYVLTQPPDRVTYRHLTPGDVEMQRIMDMGMNLGFLKKKVALSELMDRSFIPEKIVPAKIDIVRMREVVPAEGATQASPLKPSSGKASGLPAEHANKEMEKK